MKKKVIIITDILLALFSFAVKDSDALDLSVDDIQNTALKEYETLKSQQ